MKKTKLIIAAAAMALILGGGILWASDHADAPNVKGKSTDITDLYVFQGANANNLVFVGNVQGLMSPTTTKTAAFDENTMIEFKIDNNADNVEDLVIQCVYKDGNMYIYGPVKPANTGLSSTVAGPRDDPFFFDLDQFHKITGGTATSFLATGHDTFAGTNVMSVVVEVPKS